MYVPLTKVVGELPLEGRGVCRKGGLLMRCGAGRREGRAACAAPGLRMVGVAEVIASVHDSDRWRRPSSCGRLWQHGRSGWSAQVLQMASVAADGKRLPSSEGAASGARCPDIASAERLHVTGQAFFTSSTQVVSQAELAASQRPKPFASSHVGVKPASHGARGANSGPRFVSSVGLNSISGVVFEKSTTCVR